MNIMDIKESIITKAKDIGLDVIGFASCSPFSEIGDILKERETKGYLSGFEERDIEKRINPGILMNGCRTIISAGISYNVTGARAKEDTKFKCTVSKSTWGEDYHNILRNKLQELSKFIEEDLKGNTLAFVDTGPLVEREAARRAGIGYIGKNCSLINPVFGSFLFIGEILTDMYIEPDSELMDSCGDCDLCIKACPSGALCGPYTINAKKCLSYITQSRDIPPEYYGVLGRSIYGCDVCQNVCPKNKGAEASNHREFFPEDWNSYPDAVDIINMDNSRYKDTFKRTSSGWRGKKTLQRNAIIALGNSKIKDAAEYLIKTLSDDRRDIREASVLALFNLLGDDSKQVLGEHLKDEKDEHIKKLLVDILDKI
jgi:epoxyqueuosine reductase